MNPTINTAPSYPQASQIPSHRPKPPAKDLQERRPQDTYTPDEAGLQTDVLAMRRYAVGRKGSGTVSQQRPLTHMLLPNGQSSYSNLGAAHDPVLRAKISYRMAPPARTSPPVTASPVATRRSVPAMPPRVKREARPTVSSSPTVTVAHQESAAKSKPMATPKPRGVQLDLVDAVYEKTANTRMAKGSNEQICLWYAKDIYNSLMDQKEAGKLPDYQPRIYGWENAPDAEFGEAARRLGKTEAMNYTHNLAVLEDNDGNIVKILEPWQTGALWTDKLTTFDSKEQYLQERGDKWWRVGDLSGKLVPWPAEDERHARVNR